MPPFRHAFLWENGAMIDLNSLIPSNSSMELVAEIATRTLDLRACNPRRGRREDRAVKKCQSLMSRPQKRTGGRVFIPPWQDNASLSARVSVGERRNDRLE